MKLALCLFVLIPFSGFAQPNLSSGKEEAPEGEKQMRIQIEWIEVSHEKMTELLETNGEVNDGAHLSSNENDLRSEVKELIAGGEAKIIETAMLIARSGLRAKVESVLEFTYPTEFGRPEVPSHETKGTDTEPTITPHTPENFQTRNLGTTLEVDPVLGKDNRTIDLNMAPEIVYHTGYENHGGIDEKNQIMVAQFYAVKITTQVTVRNGEYLLIAAASPRNVETGQQDPTLKLLIFVKCDILVCGL